MNITRFASAALSVTLIVSGCKKKADPVYRPKPHRASKGLIHVYVTEDGSTAYQGSDDSWYWYVFVQDSGDVRTRVWEKESYGPMQVDSPRGRVVAERKEDMEELEEQTDVELPEEPESESAMSESTTETESAPSEPSSSESDSGSDSGGGDSGGSD
jgi:hypothetical protein